MHTWFLSNSFTLFNSWSVSVSPSLSICPILCLDLGLDLDSYIAGTVIGHFHNRKLFTTWFLCLTLVYNTTHPTLLVISQLSWSVCLYLSLLSLTLWLCLPTCSPLPHVRGEEKHSYKNASVERTKLIFQHIDMLYSPRQVQNLWRTAYKLTKVFAHPDYKGPMRASATIKAKLEKFKISMPIISALCNPGIKQRHWDMMSEKVGDACLLSFGCCCF